MTTTTETIGSRLRRIRTERGLSQRDLAVDAPLTPNHKGGLTAAYISLIETGKRYPTLDVIRHLAQRLGVSTEHLETGQDDANNHEPIEIHAIYRKNGTIEIRDQHGRKFNAYSESLAGLLTERPPEDAVVVDLTLEAPRWPFDTPHAELRIRIPLEVEERLQIEALRG